MQIFEMSHGHKNLSFLKFIVWQFDFNYLWSKFQNNLTLFTGDITKRTPKLGQLGPEPPKIRGLFWAKSRTANSQRLKLMNILWIDGPIAGYVKICADPLGRPQGAVLAHFSPKNGVF